MLPIKFHIKLFFLLSLAFIVSTIIGTLSHELGHYTVAKSLSYSASVSYGYTNWSDSKTRPFTDSILSKYGKELQANQQFPGKKEFDIIHKKQSKDTFWIILAGPIQTMLTGTIGLLLLLCQRRNIVAKNNLSFYQWLCIFLALFWLRQFANLVGWIVGYLVAGKFSLNADEVRIAVSSGLPKEILIVITALIAMLILTFIIFKIIPAGKRITFISAGLFGGIFGYFFWLFWAGPILMP